MRPKISQSEEYQLELGKPRLCSFIDRNNELVLLGEVINWRHFSERFGRGFHESQGRPGLPTRLMVGLTYLKYLNNLSDDKVIKHLNELSRDEELFQEAFTEKINEVAYNLDKAGLLQEAREEGQMKGKEENRIEIALNMLTDSNIDPSAV